MGKATVEELGVLHGLLVQWAKDKLQEVEPINGMTVEGPVMIGTRSAAKAADFSAIAKFLSDNKISADATNHDGLKGIEAELRNRVRRSDNVTSLPSAGAAAAGLKQVKYADEQ